VCSRCTRSVCRTRERASARARRRTYHRQHEETFYVLEGEFEFFLGNDPTVAPTGTLIVVPRGTRHNFRGTLGSRLLVVATPGGLAGFFEELAAGHAAGRPDAEVREALAGKYDSYPETA
jgi:mannose-6-phosphate isomerase-like protein (cupin superfamily)